MRLLIAADPALIPLGFLRGTAPAQPPKGDPVASGHAGAVMAGLFRTLKSTDEPDRRLAKLPSVGNAQALLPRKERRDDGESTICAASYGVFRASCSGRSIAPGEWQVGRPRPDHRNRQNQACAGEMRLDRRTRAAPRSQPPASSAAATPSKFLAPTKVGVPLVAGTLPKLGATDGEVTLRHERTFNIAMDAMTIADRVADSTILNGLMMCDRIRLSAERLNGMVPGNPVQKFR